MEPFAADLHIHSRYSRATSKALTIRSLAAWAEVKGLSVLGTGDITHPGWLDEIGRELREDGSGLLSLREPGGLAAEIPAAQGPFSGGTRFMLQGEISSIYKRGGKVRKVHNLVYLPTLEAAQKLNQKLAQVGNLASDGRPILGLDSRNLLEMVLSTHPEAFLIPAHIWTPWFSLFGSMSGFDSVEECFGDLAPEIFAMETGLSSDPGMNWTLSALDRYRMVSNSDAHSGEKLGREANLFRGQASFSGIRQALCAHLTGRSGDCDFLGTVEFFPEEGKYHMDGHRKCDWAMEPAETLAHKGLCPVCGKPATLGVLHRVLALADRPEPEQPEGQPGYDSLIPLREVLGEILDTGSGSKKVTQAYFDLLGRVGPELFVLREAPLEEVRRVSPVLAEAVGRMREGKVLRKAGFDGEYGVITVFSPEEREEMRRGLSLDGLLATGPRRGRPRLAPPMPDRAPAAEADPDPAAQGPLPGLNPEQAQAASAGPGPVLVLAGPGTGKTHTLLARLARLLESGVSAEAIAAVTFTRRAAAELAERLATKLGLDPAAQNGQRLPLADTLHALALALWTVRRGAPPVLLSEDAAKKLFCDALPDTLTRREREALFARHALSRESEEALAGPGAVDAARAAAELAAFKAERNLADFTDLVEFLAALVAEPDFVPPFAHLLVDEVQDLSALQLKAVTGLAGPTGQGFFAIGDPDQSIYGFRGAAGDVRERLAALWPETAVIGLRQNHRSGQGILDAAAALLPQSPGLCALPGAAWDIELLETPDERREAECLAERIKKLLGGTSLTLLASEGPSLAPGDIAVLVRFRALVAPLKRALELAGLPCSAPEAEVFWEDPRVAAILRAADKLHGLPPAGAPQGDELTRQAQAALPDFLLLQGPRVLPAALRESPPFDQAFWEGRAFRDLCLEYDAHGGWVGLLDWVRLEEGLAEIRHSAQKVRILTLHAAKGLEFEAVFLPALEEGVLPFSSAALAGGVRGEWTEAALAEERRLLYVGMTRARRILCLSFAARRTIYGRTVELAPSPFLADLPPGLARRTVLAQKTLARQTQLTLL